MSVPASVLSSTMAVADCQMNPRHAFYLPQVNLKGMKAWLLLLGQVNLLAFE